MSDKKITANDIRQALYARYKNTEWLLGFEVGKYEIVKQGEELKE